MWVGKQRKGQEDAESLRTLLLRALAVWLWLMLSYGWQLEHSEEEGRILTKGQILQHG